MYNHFINTFIDAQTAACWHYSAVAATEKRLFGELGDRAVRVPAVGEIINELRRTYETLATRIIWRAREQFARNGVKPLIDRATVFADAGLDIERSLALGEVPDFDRLWWVLEQRFSATGAHAGVAL